MPDLSRLAEGTEVSFKNHEEVREQLRACCEAHADLATFEVLVNSEEGRPIYGIVLGAGAQTVSLIAGAHADEPVGPETLRTFVVESLGHRQQYEALFAAYRFVIVPHINPDGAVRNQPWITRWPALSAFLKHVHREKPGRDLEFGFPAMRVENKLVSTFLRAHAPMALHMSLHGMAFSDGAMLLVERHWAGERTHVLREGFAQACRDAGLPLHDHNRKGEKGFFYIDPGFTTTPEGAAMRAHFQALQDPVTAARFHDSSMEFVRTLGGDPLCLVTELPLFLVGPHDARQPGYPAAYLAFKERLPELTKQAMHKSDLSTAITPLTVQPLELRTAMRLQLRSIALGLEALSEAFPN